MRKVVGRWRYKGEEETLRKMNLGHLALRLERKAMQTKEIKAHHYICSTCMKAVEILGAVIPSHILLWALCCR
jgi:hypothetical protein